MASELKSISGVEIFAAGKWNGDSYTVDDLDEMVRAFSEIRGTWKPALKLGHDEGQKLLQRDGYPAAGVVANLYRKGSKLLADFVDIPDKIYTLIERKAYRKVSSEIYWNIDVNGKKYKRLLSAVALLGGDMPAVSTLADILGQYRVRNADRVGVYSKHADAPMIYTLEASGMSKSEAEIKLEYELKEAREAKEKLEQDVAAKTESEQKAQAELTDLRKFKAEADERAAKAEREAAEAKLDSAVSDLEKDGLVTPAMKEFVRALIGEEKKEYSISDKKLGKTELVREVLKLHAAAADVNFKEGSKAGSEGGKASKEEKLDAEIAKYARDNKCTYAVAYKAVMKEQK